MRSIDVLGVRVDDVDEREAVTRVRELLASGSSHLIVTPNAEFVMRARTDHDFRSLLNGSALSIPDGAGLLLAARILGRPLKAQVTGTDFSVALAKMCAEDGKRLFLLGARDGVAAAAARRLQEAIPRLTIAGTYSGSADPEHDAEARAALRRALPIDVLLVAYGAPAQERWIARNSALLSVGVAMGVGGALDFIAGAVPRAPAWLRRAGFDWLYRLIRQPWRWRRQLALPRFVLAVVAARLRGEVVAGSSR